MYSLQQCWLAVTPQGLNLIITANKNETNEIRTGIITVTTGVINATIEVKQDAAVIKSRYGDVNNDGEITFLDAVLIVYYINGWPVNIDLTSAKVSGQEELTYYDAILIVQYVNNMIDVFPVESRYHI